MTALVVRPDYGLDAPTVVRNLFLIGSGALILSGFLPVFRVLIPTAAVCVIESGLMYYYSKSGKLRLRDHMLNSIAWRGDEQVLDVGTGRGLLLAGAAKRLTTGHAAGIDIWSQKDLGRNSMERTQTNLAAEGVTDRCELATMRAQELTFPDSSFDVIVSSLCIHNISRQAQRDKACEEIVRVLKPGGVALIADFLKTRRYAAVFRNCGLAVTRKRVFVLGVFGMAVLVRAEKPPTLLNK